MRTVKPDDITTEKNVLVNNLHYIKVYTMSSLLNLSIRTEQTGNVGGQSRNTDKNITQRNKKKEKQCTYNVTLGRVSLTIVAVERQQVLHIPSVCL